MTQEQNTDLDYMLCDLLDITMDELDSLPLEDVESLREEAWIYMK